MPIAERRNSNVQVDFTKEAQREFEKLSSKEKDIRSLRGTEITLKIQIDNLEQKILEAQKYGYNENSYKNKEIELRKTRNKLKIVQKEIRNLEQNQNLSDQGKENFQTLARRGISQSQKNEHEETNKENRVLTKQVSTKSTRNELGNEIKELSEKINRCVADLKRAEFAHSHYDKKLKSVQKKLDNTEKEKQEVTKKKENVKNRNWLVRLFRSNKSKLKKYDGSLAKLETNIMGLKEQANSLKQEVGQHEGNKTKLETELKELKTADKIVQQKFSDIGNQKTMDTKSKSPTRTSTGER